MKQQDIFVFGSNLAGRHGKGAALVALREHGAIYGKGRGIQGRSFAIPTKDARLQTLSLDRIDFFVKDFLEFARLNRAMKFNVTRVGCGLAGYSNAEMAPMFKGATSNCHLSDAWKEFL